jgi:hypothetical protein
MLEHDTDVDRSESSDTEPGYVHSVAPDPRRLDPLDNPVSSGLLDTFSITFTHI